MTLPVYIKQLDDAWNDFRDTTNQIEALTGALSATGGYILTVEVRSGVIIRIPAPNAGARQVITAEIDRLKALRQTAIERARAAAQAIKDLL